MGNSLPIDLAKLLAAHDVPARDAAWARLLENHSGLLLRLTRSLGGDHDIAMDRYLFVIDKLSEEDYRRLRAFAPDGPAKFTTWLLVVARNLCLDHHRSRYGRDRGTDPVDRVRRRQLMSLDLCADVDAIADFLPGPEAEKLEARDLRAALSESLDALAASDRLLLAYWYDDGMPAGEIAAIMGFPTAFHVYRRVRTLARQLRRSLAKRGFTERE